MLALAGVYAATSAQVLLLVIAVTHLEMLEQLLPFVRFDGYFILSDLIGVPDLFARVVPIVRSAAARGPPGPARRRPAAPRPDRGDHLGAVRHPAAHVHHGVPPCCTCPPINRALWRSASMQAHLMTAAVHGHHYAMAAVDAIGIALVTLSLAGSLYVVTGLARRLTALARRWSAGRPAAASWPARPAWRPWRGWPPSGPCKASSVAGSPPARHPGLAPARGQAPASEGGSPCPLYLS